MPTVAHARWYALHFHHLASAIKASPSLQPDALNSGCIVFEGQHVSSATWIAERMCQIAKHLNSLAVRMCNEPDEDGRLRRQADKAGRRLSELCRLVELEAIVDFDPRGGAQIKSTETLQPNNFGGETFTVPTL